MLRQLGGDTETTCLGKLSNQSPRYRDITSRELASADHPRFGRLRPSAIHSTPTLTQLRKQRKRKSVAVVLSAQEERERAVLGRFKGRAIPPRGRRSAGPDGQTD